MKMEDNKSIIKVLTSTSKKYDTEIDIYTSYPKDSRGWGVLIGIFIKC